jgi:hypothetical protein
MKPKNHTNKNKKGGGGCGCGSGNPILYGQSAGCVSCSKIGGGGFSISPTSILPEAHTNYPLNSYNNDPMMQTESIRMEGSTVSNNLNVTGGNDIIIGGRKRRNKKSKKSKKTKSKKSKKSKKTKSKKTKKQRGGINLGYVGQNALLGHGQYGTWFGAPTTNTPDWNASIFTSPINQNTTGYSQYNPYLV